MQAQDILDFWFDELEPAQWWKKDPEMDQLITDRFADVHRQASQCELFHWRQTPEGRLAEVLVLDQFSRNMFRDQPEAFAQDPLALALAQEAVHLGCHNKLNDTQHLFLIMPYMHSESLAVHDQAMELFAALGRPDNLDFEKRHRDIIARFGRYPHRNAILGRESTAEEQAFLEQPGSSF
jgi:uncharacterized protein (DUF924 family)